MRPEPFNLDLYRGDSYIFEFALYTDEDATQELVLTGYTVKAEIRDVPAGSVVVDLQPVASLPNIVRVAILPSMYLKIPQSAVWDVQIVAADGFVTTVVHGDVLVRGDVTESLPIPASTRVWAW